MKRMLAILTLCLMASTAAHAQMGGGGGGGGGGRRGGGGGGAHPQTTAPTPTAQTPAPPPQKAPGQIEIVGVVTAIDAATDRVTINYEETDGLNLPAGTRPFEVAKSALLKDVTVGEKVRFTLESQQIAYLQPF